MNLLENIKSLCKKNKISQRKLEKDLGLSNGSSSKWVKSSPSGDVLQKLADYFSVSIDYLMRVSASAIIEDRLSELNMSIEQLSEKTNVSVSYINNLDDYICPDEGDYERINRIALALELEPSVLKSALMRQEAPVYDNKITSLASADFEPLGEPFKIDMSNLTNIPIVGSVRAGEPILAQDNIEGYQPTLKDTLCSDKEYFYLRVQGDSMNMEFTEGSLLLIEKASWVENGSIAVVLIDGMEATVKKVIQNENMITLIPMSTNPEHVPHMYDVVKDKISIVGKVKQAIKNY